MRIAIISDHASPLRALGGVDSGGQNVYVAQIGRHLGAAGHQVDIFTRKDQQSLPEIVNWLDGVRIFHVPAGPAEFVAKEAMLPYMKDFAAYMIGFQNTHGFVYDVVHANFWMSGQVARVLKKNLGIPYAITFHALGRIRRIHQGDADKFPDERFAIEDAIVREADRIIAECPQDKSDLIEFYNAHPSAISVIPCGFDPNELWPQEKSAARSMLGFDRNVPLVLHVGRMVPRKGIDNAIRGFAHLLKTHPMSARMVIVGGEASSPDPNLTPEIGRLMGVARKEDIDSSVVFVGRRDRSALRAFYSAADVFVTTPWYEPFGITPVESMACGTPVIGSRVGGIKYTVRDGESGFLVPANDPAALGEKLAALCMDSSLRDRMGENARARALELFTWQDVADNLCSVLEEISFESRALKLAGPLRRRVRSMSSRPNVAMARAANPYGTGKVDLGPSKIQKGI